MKSNSQTLSTEPLQKSINLVHLCDTKKIIEFSSHCNKDTAFSIRKLRSCSFLSIYTHQIMIIHDITVELFSRTESTSDQ